jgi:hypothetical protein
MAGGSIEHQKFGGSGDSVRWNLAPANLRIKRVKIHNNFSNIIAATEV